LRDLQLRGNISQPVDCSRPNHLMTSRMSYAQDTIVLLNLSAQDEAKEGDCRKIE
jgi:hypothetical protein